MDTLHSHERAKGAPLKMYPECTLLLDFKDISVTQSETSSTNLLVATVFTK